MTILVTGGTGYIGREFIKKYQNDFDIISLVRATSDIEYLKSLNCKIKQFDNFRNINNVFQENKIIGVVHFASNVLVEHEESDLCNLIDSNINYGTYLLELSKQNGVKWFLNTGTFWQNYQNKDYNPVNFYAATKEAFEKIAMYYTQTSDIIFTTIKLNDTFGPNDTRPKIFNLWDKYSRLDETLDMSEGEQIIDISYIDDVLSAFKVMINNLQSENSKLYNNRSYVVSSKQRMTLKQLSILFKKVTNRNLNINWGARAYRNREVMIPLESSQLVPGWEQMYTLEEAIIKTIGEN